jgi:hypothetical protein
MEDGDQRVPHVRSNRLMISQRLPVARSREGTQIIAVGHGEFYPIRFKIQATKC